MGYQWVDDPEDDDDDSQSQASNDANNLPKAARAHLRKMERENGDLKAQVASLMANQRNAAVREAVRAKGYDPALADLIPPNVEANVEAVGKWLDDRASLFVKMTKSNDSGTQEDQGSDAGVDDETQAALAAMSRASANAQSPARQADLMAQLNDPNLTIEKLNALVNGGR